MATRLNDRLLTTAEVADHLRISRRAVGDLINRGHLSAIRVGRDWRVPTTSFDEYLERSTRPAGPVVTT